jgi:hypothetical protein
MELCLMDEVAAVLNTHTQQWRLNLVLETCCVVYHDCKALAKWLEETNHALADLFHWTGIREKPSLMHVTCRG